MFNAFLDRSKEKNLLNWLMITGCRKSSFGKINRLHFIIENGFNSSQDKKIKGCGLTLNANFQ